MFSKMFFFMIFFGSYKIKAVQRNQALSRRKESSLEQLRQQLQQLHPNVPMSSYVFC